MGGILVLAAFAGLEPAQAFVIVAIGWGAIIGVNVLFEKSGAVDPSGAKKESWIALVAFGIALLGALIFTFWIAKNLGWP